jgi:hypothetical protein
MNNDELDSILSHLFNEGLARKEPQNAGQLATMARIPLNEAHAAITAWVEREIIGEDDELRAKSDMLPTYHRNKSRNQLRELQRQRLRGGKHDS